MSQILKMFADYMIVDRRTWWIILDCGHWYHWTGKEEPKSDGAFPCPNCGTITVDEPEHMAGKGQ